MPGRNLEQDKMGEWSAMTKQRRAQFFVIMISLVTIATFLAACASKHS
jgi:hypothetical protein